MCFSHFSIKFRGRFRKRRLKPGVFPTFTNYLSPPWSSTKVMLHIHKPLMSVLRCFIQSVVIAQGHHFLYYIKEFGDFLSSPVVKTLPFTAGGPGSIPGQGTGVPHAMGCGQKCSKEISKFGSRDETAPPPAGISSNPPWGTFLYPCLLVPPFLASPDFSGSSSDLRL